MAGSEADVVVRVTQLGAGEQEMTVEGGGGRVVVARGGREAVRAAAAALERCAGDVRRDCSGSAGGSAAGVFRKLPIEVEAVMGSACRLWRRGGLPPWVGAAWAGGVLSEVPAPVPGDPPILMVRVMEGGSVPVPEGSWVIRGVRGELYPCDGGVFRETYERVR